MASQQQITTNVARRTYLISRQGFVLRVTEDSVDGSEHGTSDPLSEYLCGCWQSLFVETVSCNLWSLLMKSWSETNQFKVAFVGRSLASCTVSTGAELTLKCAVVDQIQEIERTLLAGS